VPDHCDDSKTLGAPFTPTAAAAELAPDLIGAGEALW